MTGFDHSRIHCDQPNCSSWIGDAMVSASIPETEYRALAEEVAEAAGWERAGSGWFCPSCVKRGKATEHNPDYVGDGCDRLGRPLGAMPKHESDRDRNPEGEKPEALSAEHESPGRRHRQTLGTLPPDVLALLRKFAAVCDDYDTFSNYDDDTNLSMADGSGDITVGDLREARRIVETYGAGGSGWQDISSAPKDETALAVIEPTEKNRVHAYKPTVQPVYFDEEGRVCDCSTWKPDVGIAQGYFQPTHWMPLPTPPSEEQQP